jgi:hypothetical protein
MIRSEEGKRKERERRKDGDLVVLEESVAEISNLVHRRDKNERRFFFVSCARARKEIFLAARRARTPGFHFFGRAPHALILVIDRLNPADINSGLLVSAGKSNIIGIGYCYQPISIMDLRCYDKLFF